MNYSLTGEDFFSEKVIEQLEQEGLTINWRYGYRLANRYEVRRLCPGGFGMVWIVEDQMEGAKRYAAKAPKAYFRKFTDPEEGKRRQRLASMFLNECKIWVDLGKQRHIVQAEFLEKIEGVPIVMSEYIEGGDLEQLLYTETLDIPTVLDYAVQFCLGMEYASQQGVAVHRDIKPGNIMVTKDNVVKINDFGLAKAIEAVEPIVVGEEPEPPSKAGLVTVSRGAGTPPYMAPEQFPEELLKRCGYSAPPITTRSDIFSFGLVLHEMVTGTPVSNIDFCEKAHEIRAKADDVYAKLRWEIKGYDDAHAPLPPHLSKLAEWSSQDRSYHLKWNSQDISYPLMWHSLTPGLLACNKHLDDIIIKSLKIDPEERYESFSELKGELLKLYRQVTGKGYEVIEEPAYKPSWRNMGKTYWILGREEEAFESYDEALEENPGDTTAWLEKGISFAEVGKLREFRGCLETISYLKPSSRGETMYLRGVLDAEAVFPRDLRLLQELSYEYEIPEAVYKALQSELREHLDDPFRERDLVLASLQEQVRDERVAVRRSAAKALGSVRDGAGLPALVEAVRDEDAEVRERAAQALAILGDTSALPALIEALRDNYWRVPHIAAEALGNLGDSSAVPALIEALHHNSDLVRHRAAEALGKLGDTSAVPALIEALRDRTSTVCEAATEALVKLGGTSAVRAVIDLLRDRDVWVRWGAASALGRIGDVSAIPALIEATERDDSCYVRLQATIALMKLGYNPEVSVFIQALRSEHQIMRFNAAKALGELGDTSAVPALIEALRDKDNNVRLQAVRALRKVGDSSAVPALIEALGDKYDYVRSEAPIALGKLGDSSAVPAIIEALRNKDILARSAFVAALLELVDRSAVPALIKSLGDEDSGVRQVALRGLVKLGDTSAVPALIEALRDKDNNVRLQAVKTLGELGDSSVVPALIEVLDDKALGVRREEAVKALGNLGDTSAVPALIETLRDKHIEVREQAAIALGKLGDSSAVPALIEALRELRGDKSFARSRVAEALSALGDSSAFPALMDTFLDDDPLVRWCAIRTLSELGNRSTATMLIQALRIRAARHSALQTLRRTFSKPSDQEGVEKPKRLKEYSAFAWHKRGTELAAQGQYQEALACFDKAIEIDPDWDEPKKGKEECLRKLG